MPVGGDVTRFFLGLMEVLTHALQEGRLPIWNDLWGYGFPGLGESQMGVYYPPHLILYGLLRTEWAYVASLVLHTLWGALGVWWAGRRFGVSPVGSGLAAFTFSASGFFVIHLAHPWGYTTGSWLPWAWGLSWSILFSEQPRLIRRLFLLSLVLVLQLLPGHFQIAFLTQVCLVVMIVCSGLESRLRGAQAGGQREEPGQPRLDGTSAGGRGMPVPGFPPGCASALADGPAGPSGGIPARFQLPFGVRLEPLAPGELRRAGTVSPVATLAAPGLGPVSYFARGALAVCRPGAVVPGSPRDAVRIPPRSSGRGTGHPCRGRTPSQSGPLSAGFPAIDPPARVFLLPSPGPLEPCHLTGSGDAGGERAGTVPPVAPTRSFAQACWLFSPVSGCCSCWRSWSWPCSAAHHAASPGQGASFRMLFQARPWSNDPDFLSVLAQARKPATDPRIPPALRAGRDCFSTPRPTEFPGTPRRDLHSASSGTAWESSPRS